MRMTHSAMFLSVCSVAVLWGCRGDAPVDAPTSPAMDNAAASATATVEGAAPAAKGDTLCSLIGSTAEQVSCPLSLLTEGTPAAGVQLRVDWDPKAMVWTGIRSERCKPDGACKDVMSPPYKTVGTYGHSLVTSEIDQGNGSVTLMIVHSSKPDATLKDDVGELVFKLRRTVLERDASPVTVSEVVVTSAAAVTLPTRIEAGRIRVGK